MSKQTAVEWLYERLERMIPKTALYNIDKKQYFEQAKAMEREQHGSTWDAAIEQNEKRGGNAVRSQDDFDEYYNQTYKGGEQ